MEKSRKKRVFIVDTENTNDYSFVEKYNLNKKDTVVLFSSVNSKPIKTESLKKFLDKNVDLEVEQVKVGTKNAMDHQIIIYLTLSCSTDSEKEYYIVSNDSDYNFPIEYLSKLCAVKIKQIGILPKEKTKSVKPSFESKIINEIRIVFPNKYKDIYAEVINIICENSNKNDIHNKLVNEYGENGQLLYRRIKRYISEFWREKVI